MSAYSLTAGAQWWATATRERTLVVPEEPVPVGVMAAETRRLSKRFRGVDVLAGADLAIPDGALGVVLGPPGAGKSVLLKLMVGLLEPDAGEVMFHGRELSRMSRSEIVALRADIGVMFQDGALFSAMTVFD